MDIYTFRSEFERIVQPSRQIIYWLDALKRNSLSGPDLALVEQILTMNLPGELAKHFVHYAKTHVADVDMKAKMEEFNLRKT